MNRVQSHGRIYWCRTDIFGKAPDRNVQLDPIGTPVISCPFHKHLVRPLAICQPLRAQHGRSLVRDTEDPSGLGRDALTTKD